MKKCGHKALVSGYTNLPFCKASTRKEKRFPSIARRRRDRVSTPSTATVYLHLVIFHTGNCLRDQILVVVHYRILREPGFWLFWHFIPCHVHFIRKWLVRIWYTLEAKQSTQPSKVGYQGSRDNQTKRRRGTATPAKICLNREEISKYRRNNRSISW